LPIKGLGGGDGGGSPMVMSSVSAGWVIVGEECLEVPSANLANRAAFD